MAGLGQPTKIYEAQNTGAHTHTLATAELPSHSSHTHTIPWNTPSVREQEVLELCAKILDNAESAHKSRVMAQAIQATIIERAQLRYQPPTEEVPPATTFARRLELLRD